ncbi:MAG: hypothetical protein GY711_35820 [bacterium]|nr:hypothetical protein [bacterium]
MRTALLPLLCVVFASCGGGGGGSSDITIEGITAPGSVSIVTPDDDSTPGAGIPPGTVIPGASGYPLDSDYMTDTASVWVWDPSMDDLETVNSILCQIGMTRAGTLVNRGAYLAQIDEALCKTGSAEDDSSGQSTAAESDITIWTVNSRRDSLNGSQVVRAWVPQREGGRPDATIYAHMDIKKRVSFGRPFGKFDMSFASVEDVGGSLANPTFKGIMRTVENGATGRGFQFYSAHGDVSIPAANPGDYAESVQLNVSMDRVTDRGTARILKSSRFNFGGGDSGLQTREWKIAFNATHLKRQLDGGAEVTLDRNDYNTSAWRYNLYHAAGPDIGERVELNSGFGFRTQADEYGWIGYYGMWTPEGVTVAHGDTIIRNEWGDDGPGEAFTVVRAPGRLIKNERATLELTRLGGQLFQYWESPNQYQVDYDGVDFRKIAVWDEINEEWDALTPPIAIDVSAAGGWLSMWSQTLGGQVSYVDGDMDITYFEQSFVNGSDPLLAGGTAQLFGFVECLDAELTAGEVEAGTIYLADAPNVATPHSYRFGATDLTLYYDVAGDASTLTQVGLLPGQEPTTGNYVWGMRSGPLVTDTAGLVNVYDVWNEPVFYVYETGHNEWNQLAAVKDITDTFVDFDRPLSFLYTHTTGNDRNDDATYDMQSYVLDYQGSGNLHGIPHEGVDLTGDMQEDRYYPVFSIEDGVLVGPSDEYVLRGTELEQTLQEDPGGAPTLDLTPAQTLVLPDETMYVTPDMGPPPVVTDPPRVINGVIVR